MEKKYPLFSNGTECDVWQSRNCEQCVKAVFYNAKKDYYPKFRCAIQKHIEIAAVTDGMGSQRDYHVTHSEICPYRATERTPQKRKAKTDKNQLQLF